MHVSFDPTLMDKAPIRQKNDMIIFCMSFRYYREIHWLEVEGVSFVGVASMLLVIHLRQGISKYSATAFAALITLTQPFARCFTREELL